MTEILSSERVLISQKVRVQNLLLQWTGFSSVTEDPQIFLVPVVLDRHHPVFPDADDLVKRLFKGKFT